MSVNPSLLHRLFYPQVPAVLSAASAGRVSAMPVVSYASVSDSPPLVAVACRAGSYTLQLAARARKFSLCILGSEMADAVGRLAGTSGRKAKDNITACGLRHRPGEVLGVPVIRGAEAVIECEIESRKRVGDHVLLVGRVAACRASRKFDEYWDFSKYRPILYAGWRGKLTTYPSARP